jgi:hypothetical protein
MKKTINVQTMFDNRSSDFKTSQNKNRKRNEKRDNKNSFDDKSKTSNRRQNADEKKRKRSNHFHLICHKCNEIEHIATNCLDFKKKLKINAIFNKFKRSKISKKRKIFDDDWSIVENEELIKFKINLSFKILVDDAQTALIKLVDDQSTRKSMKSVSIMIVQEIIIMSNAKHFNKISLNENAEINVISYRYAIAHDMTSINNDLSISSHVKEKSMHCYDAYNVRIRFVDNWKQKRVFETIFYVLNKNEMSNMIFELSKLKQIETKLNYQMLIWRCEFSKQTLKITSINDFAKEINHHDSIYVVMIQSYKSDTKIKINAVSTFIENVDDSAKKMSFEFKKFDDVFLLKNEKISISHKERVNHVIELKNDKQSFFQSFYNLFNNELKTLRLYLDDALTRDIIKHSMSSIETSVFFVLKKNEKLRLCVDYRNLNKIIRKNRHFLSLIIQILNQLKDCRFFIKIDLTNAYNRILIKKKDE